MKNILLILLLSMMIAVGCNKNLNTATAPLSSINSSQTTEIIPTLDIDTQEIIIKDEVTYNPAKIIPKDWKIYSNNQYGFQFSHPADWKIITPTPYKESGSIVAFRSAETIKYLQEPNNIGDSYSYDLVIIYSPNFKVFNNKWGSNNQGVEYKNLAAFMDNSTFDIIKNLDITINGLKAYKVTFGGFGANSGVVFEHKGIYELSYERQAEETLPNSSTMDTITSSFKFIK